MPRGIWFADTLIRILNANSDQQIVAVIYVYSPLLKHRQPPFMYIKM